MRHTHLSSQPLNSSTSVFSFLKIALLGAVLFIMPMTVFADIVNTKNMNTLSDQFSCTNWNGSHVYQYLGQGISGTLSQVELKVSNPGTVYYGKFISVWVYESDTKLNSIAEIEAATLVWHKGNGWASLIYIGGYDGIVSFVEPDSGATYDFKPEKHYYLLPRFHTSDGGGICQLSSMYGSPDPLSFPYGEFASDSHIADMYFKLKGLNQTAVVTSSGLSNVLFLPGLEASRLYTQRGVTCDINCEDQLWESNKKTDVEDLYLNPDGTSKKSGIYTRDAITETNTPVPLGFAGQNIYKSFFETLDSLTDPLLPERMARWESYAYDWRYSVDDIVEHGTRYQRGQKSLIETLENLIASSTTGKVTIIGHSNGGLLAKALMVKLQHMKDVGESALIDHIDTVILVASPQIGTAVAVPVLLHGYDQKIAGGVLLDEEHARELGRNMPGAYGLLPSEEYINRMDISPVTFTGSGLPGVVTTPYINAYGSTIDSYPEYKNFLLGQEGRVDPATTATKLPIKLSSSLLAQAETLHDRIDAWAPPANIRLIEIAGWGLDTVASFNYIPKYSQSCTEIGIVNCYILDQKPVFTVDGDKTVVEPSALFMTGQKYWVNFQDYNSLSKVNREHKDILEVDSLNNLIKSVISKTGIVFDTVLKNTKPIDTKNRLRISIHSPVSIGSYDSLGNFTGKVCLDTEDFCYVQEDIPNSSYLEFGEGKYINLPEENLQKAVLQGTGTGTFTYISEKVTPEGHTTTSTFTDIPVTTQTQGEVVFNTTTQLPELTLDVTGDGTIDFTLAPTSEFDPVVFLQIMKKTIESFDIRQARKTTLSKRIDGIIRSIQKGKIPKAQLKAERFQNVLKVKVAKPLPKKLKPQRLTNADAEVLIGMLETLLNNLEK